MKLLIIAIGVIALTVVTLDFRQAPSAGQSSAPVVAKAKTLEEQLATLQKCGVGLAAPFTVDELLSSFDREVYERDGYESVVWALGITEEREPWRNRSVNVWSFDPEVIYDNGAYKEIAERMVELTQGGLRLRNIRDHVDFKKRQAWLSFTFKGKRFKINLAVNDDRADPRVFDKFPELLKQSDPSKIYIYIDNGDHRRDGGLLISCVTKENFECLKNLGLNFTPL